MVVGRVGAGTYPTNIHIRAHIRACTLATHATRLLTDADTVLHMKLVSGQLFDVCLLDISA